MNKISVHIIGPDKKNYGLGNQLFQIAAVLSYAKDYNFEPIFPCLNNKEHYGNYTDNILRNLTIADFFLGEYVDISNPDPVYKPIPSSDKSIVIHNSYLQSEKYFSHNRELISDTLCPSQEDKQYLLDKYPNVSDSISCHIRRGDYMNFPDKYTSLCDTDYYTNALEIMDDGPIIVFSDDIEWCKENFRPAGRDLFFAKEEDYLELYLMSMCKHAIIANSTFSWWGAWLNKHQNKKVVAPANWFTANQNRKDVNLIPQDWIVI